MKFETVLLAAGLVLPASGALAEPVTLIRDAKTLAGSTSLSADELRRAVAGKTVYLDVSGFELPIRYLDSGRMSGTMGTVAATLSIGDLCIGQRRLVDRGQLSLPAVDKLVGQQNLLLQARSPWRYRAVVPQ